jgi:hypothetical protein
MKLRPLFDSFLRIMGALFCIGLLIIGIAWCWPYGDALIWHIRNGNTANIGGFRVPIATWVRPEPGYPLRFDLRHGQFSSVDIELGRKVTPGDKWKEGMEANSKSANPKMAELAKHFLAMKTIKLMIADQPSFCIDDGLTIHCIPEHQERGLGIDFIGSPDLKPVFYETLGRIKRIAPQ